GVFSDPEMVWTVAERLKDKEEILRAKAFPYQLLSAYRMADATVPMEVRAALQAAMEVAIRNVPEIEGKVYVLPDVSGSMASPVTGHRKGAATAVRCIDVAALVAAAILRKNPSAEVLPFETCVVPVRLNPLDSVMTNADKLAAIGGGGTNCSAPLKVLNGRKERGDLVILVSDNQSWVDARRNGSTLMHEWSMFRERNPQARMVCMDLQPGATTQAMDRADILNVGGFSDSVFEVVAEFSRGRFQEEHWVKSIEEIKL
ncbi:MAG TPA: RNA-binding protein, partial [Planctomycetota bacterium]|nr:RNA-binding protein [Planctomycetota bacterium]